MQIGFISYCVLRCSPDSFPLFVVRLLCYVHHQIQGKEPKASGLCEHPPGDSRRLRMDLRQLREGRSSFQGTAGSGSTSPDGGAGSATSCPALAPSLSGSSCWPSRSIGTEFPRETLCITTFFCVGIIYSTSLPDAYHIFQQSFEVAVLCFAPVIKSQY